MAVLYVASDKEEAGKTAFCAALAEILSQEGKKVALFKPLAAGSSGNDRDVDVFQQLLGDRPILVASEKLTQGTNQGKVIQAFRNVSLDRDAIIIEGLSGLDNPVSGELAQDMDAKVVVVVGYQPSIKTEDLAHAKGLFGERLLGLVINGATKYMGIHIRESLLPSLESQGLHVWGVVPEDRYLLSATVRQLTEHLQGRIIGNVDQDNENKLVEHFLIGGMILDWAVPYFELYKNKAVIVRGDRPDIQMSTLQTPTTCLVLTGGIEPIEYVRYEAGEEGVPVIVVGPDTLSTASTLEALTQQTGFDHHMKLERFRKLLEGNVDLQALNSGLGL